MKITICSPFANKEYCFNDYAESIENLIIPEDVELVYVIYDNTNSELGKRIKNWAENLKKFKQVIYYEDKSPHFVIETTEDYALCSKKIAEIYKLTFLKLAPEDTDFILNIEDDIAFQQDALVRALKIFQENEEIVTVAGSSYGRRLRDRAFGIPQAWKFSGTWEYPASIVMPKINSHRMPERPFGWEVVGSTSLGFWLTKYKTIKELGWKLEEDGICAGDICWGYRVMKYKKGYVVIEWGIPLKHFFLNEKKEKDYFTYGRLVEEGVDYKLNVTEAPKTKG